MIKQCGNKTYQASAYRKTTGRAFACCRLFFAACFLMLTGCASIVKMPEVDTSFLKPAGPVTSVSASWIPAISNGEVPERGFGGRVYFHDQEMRPVKIKGSVIVYVFEEDGRSPNDAKPNEGIVFDEKTLNSKGMYAKTSLGHSYNLWVPIDTATPESPAKKVSLIVRYIPNQGIPQMSVQTTLHLPGRSDHLVQDQPISTPDQSNHSVPHVFGTRPLILESVTIR